MPEQVIATFHPTRFLFWRYYLVGLLFIILGIIMFLGFVPTIEMIPNYYYLGFLVIGLIPILVAEKQRRDDKYIFTSQKITERVGSLSIQENTVSWDRLSNYTLSQTFLDRILGTGTIELWSIGEEMKPEVSIKKVSHIKKVLELLDKLIKTRTGPVV